jgi:hypothetical protein
MKITETYSVTFSEVTSAEWAGGSLFGNFPRLSFKHPSKSGHILQPHQYLEDALASDAAASLRI